MASTKKAHEWKAGAEEDPATAGIGTTLAQAGERIRPVSTLQFYIYNSPSNPDVFLVLTSPDALESAPKPKRGDWHLFKIVPELGRPRIGFSEAEAKQDIARQGFHLVGISIQTRVTEGVAPPKRRSVNQA